MLLPLLSRVYGPEYGARVWPPTVDSKKVWTWAQDDLCWFYSLSGGWSCSNFLASTVQGRARTKYDSDAGFRVRVKYDNHNSLVDNDKAASST